MLYSMYFSLAAATMQIEAADGPAETAPDFDAVTAPPLDGLRQLAEAFRHGSVTPQSTVQFEKDVQQAVRELAKHIVQWAYNHLEPAARSDVPPQVQFEGNSYRPLAAQTPQAVSTLFGAITLRRWGYRAPASAGEPVLFPLCRALGVVHGATPALIERIALYQAASGATQRQTLTRLRQEHGVAMGVKRLRQLTTFVAEAVAEYRLDTQADQVLDWLTQAQASRGRHRPVLSTGRDGITLGLQLKGCAIYEVASTGTISVCDRRGKRLGTVYLACTPESGQGTMSSQLTQLLQEILRRWQGPAPRLCYVTDAGDNETAYYRNVLRRMRHPCTNKKLNWFWVVDYYHASERLWTMAEKLFGSGKKSAAWARRMQKLLLKRGGVGRVLHSAAALRSRRQLAGKRLADFGRAYRYLQNRRQHLRYADYRRQGLPIGSGVTEAACKTVYTQRLKLSGMRWHKAGAQTILTLRVLVLSGVWAKAYERTLLAQSEVQVLTPEEWKHSAAVKAA
jgi:hypothetical protein